MSNGIRLEGNDFTFFLPLWSRFNGSYFTNVQCNLPCSTFMFYFGEVSPKNVAYSSSGDATPSSNTPPEEESTDSSLVEDEGLPKPRKRRINLPFGKKAKTPAWLPLRFSPAWLQTGQFFWIFVWQKAMTFRPRIWDFYNQIFCKYKFLGPETSLPDKYRRYIENSAKCIAYIFEWLVVLV